MTSLIHIADRVLNRPLLITRDKAQVILQVLSGRIGVNSPEASRFEGDNIERDENGEPVFVTNMWGDKVPKRKPYNVKDGVAIVTITGSLVNRGAWVGAYSGLTSYEGIGHQLKTALDDAAVRAVILDLHSPGGEAVGAFETAELVRTLAASKPTIAVVNGMAASAAYAIASAANEIVTTETGVSGSIGVVLLHADFSRQLDRDGITPTLIHAGAHKVDGNPFEPLTDAVRGDLQAEVNSFYEAFLKTVAKGRGSRLTVAAARKTEARIFIGQEAVAAGVADRVGSFETVLSELIRAKPTGQRSTSPNRSRPMSEITGAPAAENAGILQADHDRAVAAARTEGAQAAATRLAGILDADGIKGDPARMAAALDLAIKSPGMSAEDVAGFVTANVTKADPAAGYEAQRVAAAGLAQPSPRSAERRADLNASNIYAARRKAKQEG